MRPPGPGWLPVLMYHRVVERRPPHDPFQNCVLLDDFRSQMAWLRHRGYRALPLVELEAALAGEGPGGRPVVITFDDGYQDTYSLAWPVLRGFGLTAAIFVVAGTIGGHNAFDARFGVETVPMMGAAQLRALQREGADIGSHTLTHPPDLLALPDDRVDYELAASRRALEELLDVPVPYFAYPRSRHDPKVEEAVLRHYRLAVAGQGPHLRAGCVNRVIGPSGRGRALWLQITRRRIRTAAYHRLKG